MPREIRDERERELTHMRIYIYITQRGQDSTRAGGNEKHESKSLKVALIDKYCALHTQR